MGDHDTTPTCLSAEPHGPEVIRDILAHYFGCIEIHERPNFLSRSGNKSYWDKEVQLEIQKLNQQDGNDETKQDFRDRAEENVKKKIRSHAISIEAQYKRTDTLRRALEGVKCPHERDGGHSEDCNLVKCLAASFDKWRGDKTTKKGIRDIREWKRTNNRPTDTFTPDPRTVDLGRCEVLDLIGSNENTGESSDDEAKKYDLERDINGYIMEWDICNPERKGTEGNDPGQLSASASFNRPSPGLRRQSTPAISRTTTEQLTEDIQPQREFDQREEFRRPSLGVPKDSYMSHASKSFYKSLSADERYLKPTDRKDDYRFKESNGPEEADEGEESGDESIVLNKNGHPDRVRYIHIPHNNMAQAIARYFGDRKPDHGRIYRAPPVKTRSHMILRPEYWRGQQHGGRRKIWDSEDNPGNVVLFMPYLHWEEDRKRDKIAKIIDEETAKHRKKRDDEAKEAKKNRVDFRTFAGKPLTTTRTAPTHPPEDPNYLSRIQEELKKRASTASLPGIHRTVTEVAKGFADRTGPAKDEKHEDGQQRLWYVAKLKTDSHGKIKARSKLGQLLLDAARLYEAIAIYRDEQLLKKYLHHDPPLHPRRTLDQSYYWTLKTTKARDRDQVVYRGTTMDDRNMHRFRELGKKDCAGEEGWIRKHLALERLLHHKTDDLCERNRDPDNTSDTFRWDDHWIGTDTNGCDHCRGEIRKVSRVVMVDQLWMWILDKKTIITSFPKRYGANKQDPSGVHKSIRTRIKNARKNQIRSVFDVALIILDECSNTFFDRTKTPDRHPQVMDIFGDAIGNLTVSFHHLWHWTKRASQLYVSKFKYEDASHLHPPLLNINPEGKLQREIKDIIDELDIMININNKQKEVIKRFTKHVENIYDSSGEWRDNSRSPDDDRDYRKTASSRASSLERKLDESNEKEAKEVKEAKRIRERERQEFIWFRKQAYDLISDVGDRVLELEGLRKSAESTAQGIKDLLDLKQQQASILQAWQSVKQADETVRQGRSIMIFTIVTIIFLPLSFMSSVFGMNNSTIGSDKMTFGDQANFMSYKMLETWVLVYTGAYYVWLMVWDKYKKFMKSDDLLKNLEKEVNRIKGKVKDSRKKRLDRNQDQKTDQRNTDTNGNKPQGRRSLQNVHNSALSTEQEGLREQGSDTSKTEVESRSRGSWRSRRPFWRSPKDQGSGQAAEV
ncbi:ankyrin repeat protein [Colletotrichum chrysophilum]|uniref:Ankyrin repeat protein n=1 Tax=Colletotrichum chrysophilum TaxID=1836956 RepID=A0AAD9B2C1_9PEZI|nr:ankyrin repeat protein [Colletotrichum chrysophilum]